VSTTGVALAYVMHRASHVLPTCGGRKTDHLKGNIDALALSLSDEKMAEIDNAWSFDVGFPLSFLSQTPAGAKRS
jgi:aryl-alcohol dehydrogenase-like predicted oxidoreductase